MQRQILGINVDFNITGQLFITYSALFKHLRTKYETVHKLCIDFLKTRL